MSSTFTLPIVFDILSFGSALILALTILIALCSKRAFRGKGWFCMLSCWLLYAISYGLLVGKQSGPEPGFGLCVTQAVLVYGAPPLAGVGTLSFFLDFYFGSCWDPSRRRSLGTVAAYTLMALPFIVHLAIDIEVIILIVTSPLNPAVRRVDSNMYCHLVETGLPSAVSGTIVALVAVVLVPLEVWTGIQLYRSQSTLPREDFRQYLAVYLRIAACTILSVASFGAGMIEVVPVNKTDNSKAFLSLGFPCTSMAVALIFASQKDLLAVWLDPLSSYFNMNRNVIRADNILRLEKSKEFGRNRSSTLNPPRKTSM